MFKKMLIAMDQSPLGEMVFNKAFALAKELKSSLMLLHVLSADEEGSPSFHLPSAAVGGRSVVLDNAAFEIYQKEWQLYQQKGMDFLRTHEALATQAGLSVEFTQTAGHPGRIICSLAKTWEADLIVVGRRGRSGLNELLLGSISNYVLHHAPCEVLTIHTPHHA